MQKINLNLTAKQYVKKVWSKYPNEKRIAMQKLLKPEGATFKELIKFETSLITKTWENIKILLKKREDNE